MAKKVKKSTKERFIDLLNECGFPSINKFSHACGIENANVLTNLNGKYKISVNRLFIFADTLGVPFDTVLEIFYPEEYAKHFKAIKMK